MGMKRLREAVLIAASFFLLGAVVFYSSSGRSSSSDMGSQRTSALTLSLISSPKPSDVRAPPRSLVSLREKVTRAVTTRNDSRQLDAGNDDFVHSALKHAIVPMYRSGAGARSKAEAEHVMQVGAQVVEDARVCVNEEYGSKIMSSGHKFLFNEWVKLAHRLGIRYMLTAGTLYGAVTIGAPLPWDLDFDLAVDIRDIPKLAPLAEVLPFTDYGEEDEEAVYGKDADETDLARFESDEYLKQQRKSENAKRFHIFLHPDWEKVSHDRRRMTCWGEPADVQVDHCSFMEPHGRMLGSPINKYMHIDIFAYSVDESARKVTLLLDEEIEYDMDEILPHVTCEFFGLPASCAKEGVNILKNKYGDNWLKLLEEYSCKEGVFRKDENFKRD